MKVNLQFSVDIDRVPDEIGRLIFKTAMEMVTAADELKMVDIIDGNPYYANKQVDEVRQSLVPLDNALEEIQALIVSYQVALTEVMSKPDSKQENTSLASPTADTVAGWDKSLSELREQLGGSDDKNNEER
jgi:hypothetical protein